MRKFQSKKMTDLQVKESLSPLIGKLALWQGHVSKADEENGKLIVEAKCLPGTVTYDVRIYFDDSWRSELLKLKKGQRISFKGKIANYEYDNLFGLFLYLHNGELVK